MSQYIFGQPYTYKDWYIFPDTTLDNLKLDDCPSSVTGKCENVKTVEECIQICHDNQPCFAGYFIETPDRKNICVPIRKISGGPSIGPYYRLRNQNIYPELKNVKSSVFTSQIYKFPPDRANNIFYTDNFVLTNISTNKSIGFSKDEGQNSIGDLLTDNPIYIQYLPKNIARTYTSRYLMVKNGDEIIINVPNTAYTLKDYNKLISWNMNISTVENSQNIFQVFSADINKKLGDFLDYQDILYLKRNGNFVIYDHNLEILRPTTDNLSENTDAYFKPTPKVQIYYCEQNECKTAILEETDMYQEKATYKGSRVSRNPSCWGTCGKRSKSRKRWWIWVLSVIAIIILVVFLFSKR